MTIENDNQPGGKLLLYQKENGRTHIDCRFDHETLWLTQAQIADLLQTTPQNITLHLKAIKAEGEQTEAATCKFFLQVQQEGGRSVRRHARGAVPPAPTLGIRRSETSSKKIDKNFSLNTIKLNK